MAVALPPFDDLAWRSLEFASVLAPGTLLLLAAIGVFVSLAAGGYPALLLARFDPAEVLKGQHASGRRGMGLRRALVVFQFAASVFLQPGTMVIARQRRYVEARDLGFDGDCVVVLSVGNQSLRNQVEAVKTRLEAIPNVVRTSAVNSVPGFQRSGFGLEAEGLPGTEEQGNTPVVNGIPADRDVADTPTCTRRSAHRRSSSSPGSSPTSW